MAGTFRRRRGEYLKDSTARLMACLFGGLVAGLVSALIDTPSASQWWLPVVDGAVIAAALLIGDAIRRRTKR